ncbi:TolC family protein [Aquimarina sp. AD10]|uniref:TolC family protein n=1 Tax=Aquimarina sp. AD10 TaxID=1714849 RepID=UPI000E51B8AD|nr:TolC family protein [Aquimarina sp. AD10]AXT61329.1 TolC family protein [Aquimarina sp. AD10]RKN01476.1 TolC family protein [Aquimarina sp. AD10]
MKNNLWLLCLGWLFTATLQAQQSPIDTIYSFTLDEAVEFALENSYQSINARRDVAKALKRKWETTADGLPQIEGVIDYQNQLKQPVTVLPGEVVGGTPGTFVPVVFGVKQQASATATLRQLIFDGSYLVGLEAAKSFLQFSNDSQEKVQLEVRKAVINAYGSVLVAQESVLILKKNVETLEKNYQETKKIFENGLAEEEDVEQLQITLLQIKNQLSNTERLEKIAMQMFNLTIGVDVNASTELSDKLEDLSMKNMDKSVITTPFVIENNIDYRLAELLTEQRRLELKLEKSKALPRLSAFVNYGTAAFDNDFVFLDSDTPWFQSSILGASLNIPIFSSFKRSAKTKQAKIAEDQAKTDFLRTQNELRLKYDSSISDFKFSIESYDTAKQNLALAERIEKKNQIKYSEGLATSFDLRQAQLQLYSSQQELLQAMLDIINKKAKLETILNTPQSTNN